jgi:hypothetical protein
MYVFCQCRPCPIQLTDIVSFCVFKIRIQGYKAVVQMSREQPGSVERNVDVLVQLLQSGEFFTAYTMKRVAF